MKIRENLAKFTLYDLDLNQAEWDRTYTLDLGNLGYFSIAGF